MRNFRLCKSTILKLPVATLTVGLVTLETVTLTVSKMLVRSGFTLVIEDDPNDSIATEVFVTTGGRGKSVHRLYKLRRLLISTPTTSTEKTAGFVYTIFFSKRGQ